MLAPPMPRTLITTALLLAAVVATIAADSEWLPPSLIANEPKANATKCSGGSVLTFSDGIQERCISVIAPTGQKMTLAPVLFWFHGSGGNAADCDRHPLSHLAQQYGFALVCGEAVQFEHGGQWHIPQVITDATGTPCGDSDTYEVPYIRGALAALRAQGGLDLSRIFFSGCSQGSGFSTFISTCTKQDNTTAGSLSAFATHSTGLKTKGDGIEWDCCSDIEQCAACQYFPAKPFAVPATDALGLKACVFDNAEDRLPPGTTNPFFYLSSKELAAQWAAAGNRVETHFGAGGHCLVHSWMKIVSCLDDTTGRLIGQRALVEARAGARLGGVDVEGGVEM